MSECFQISIIVRKIYTSIDSIESFVTGILDLTIGDNYVSESKFSLFKKRDVNVSVFKDEDCDFDELLFCVSDYVLGRDNFDVELAKLGEFGHEVFARQSGVYCILCSYELNGYLLSDVKSVDQIGQKFGNFPIIFSIEEGRITQKININAQDIFSRS